MKPKKLSTPRVKKHRQAKLKAGMVRLDYLWTWPQHVQTIKKFVEKLNG